jgi:hypothetical protein
VLNTEREFSTRSVDPQEFKQTVHHKFFFMGAPFILIWTYYRFNPLTTGIDLIVPTLSYIITSAVILGNILSGTYFKFTKKNRIEAYSITVKKSSRYS